MNNWKKSCDHQGSLLGGWVCARACVCFYSFVSLFVSVGQSCQSSSRWWVSTLSDGLQIHLVIDQKRPFRRPDQSTDLELWLNRCDRPPDFSRMSSSLSSPSEISNWSELDAPLEPHPRCGGPLEPQTHGDAKQRTTVFGTTALPVLSAFPG